MLEKINKAIEMLQAKPDLTDKEQQILENLLQQKHILENNTEISSVLSRLGENWWTVDKLKQIIQEWWDKLEWLSELSDLMELWSDLVEIVWTVYEGTTLIVSGIWGILWWIKDLLTSLTDVFWGFSW